MVWTRDIEGCSQLSVRTWRMSSAIAISALSISAPSIIHARKVAALATSPEQKMKVMSQLADIYL